MQEISMAYSQIPLFTIQPNFGYYALFPKNGFFKIKKKTPHSLVLKQSFIF
jgi:hypothetical protein